MKTRMAMGVAVSGLLAVVLGLGAAAPVLADEGAAGSAGQPGDAAAPAAQPVAEAHGHSFDITLGIRGGVIHHDIIEHFSATAPTVNPILDLRYGDWGLGFSFLYADLSADANVDFPAPSDLGVQLVTALSQVLPAPVAQQIAAQLGESLGSQFTVRAKGEDTRMDFDVSLKYSLNRYVTPFIGYRHELFSNTKISFEVTDPSPEEIGAAIASLPPEAQAAILGVLEQNSPNTFDENIDINLTAFGAALQYPFDFGLVPYFVGTGFPYGEIEGADDTWVGYALEAGAAFLLSDYLGQPVYITATAKYQDISIDEPVKMFDQIAPGASLLLPAQETVISGFIGVYYRFSL